MNYIVLDLEWNQSTTEKHKSRKKPPFEIIEIGAVKLNENFEIIDHFESVIRPVIYPHLNHISQELTGITINELKTAKTFPSVFRRFLTWCGNEDFRFCTWGPLDITELQRNMDYYKFDLFPAPVYYYDLQEIFCLNHDESELRRSLEYVVEFFHITKEQDFHRAYNDAYYTALVMQQMGSNEILTNYTADTYQVPQSAAQAIHISYGEHSKYISQEFDNKIMALKDAEVLSTKCCKCQKRLRKKIHWFSENSKNYHSLAYCPQHGFMEGRLRFKKTEREAGYIIKELKMISKNDANSLYDRQKEYKRKKRQKKAQHKWSPLAMILLLISMTVHATIFSYGQETDTEIPWPQAPAVYGSASILMDADTGAILHASNEHQVLYPASITKIMTGLLCAETLSPNDTITYTSELLASIPGDAARLGLLAGETTTIQDALHALLLRSANEVATGLACKISGTESEFGKKMTARAIELGATNTNFTNASGLHDDNHYTTAYDMALITKGAIDNYQLLNALGKENYTLAATNMTESYRIWHRHYLMLSNSEYYYPHAIAGKTGYTDQAGRTLVTVAQKDGMTLICVIMNSDNDHIFSDTISLFEFGFQNFTKVSTQSSETRFGSGSGNIPVFEKLYGNNNDIFSISDEYVVLPKNVSLSQIPYSIEFLDTPQRNIIGHITYSYNQHFIGKVNLLMNLSADENDIITGPQKNDTPTDTVSIRETKPINIYLIIGIFVGILLSVFIILKLRKRHIKKKERKKRRTYYDYR